MLRIAAAGVVAVTMLALAGCSGDADGVELAKANVASAEKAVSEAAEQAAAASEAFCQSSETYIEALDRYGDVLNDTAPTVGDVTTAGADLNRPRDNAFDAAGEAVDAQQQLADAEQELAEARAALERVQAGTSATPTEPAAEQPPAAPVVPQATVERVQQAETEFTDARAAITDQTPLTEASEQFNAAAVALEISWLRLFADAGCLTDEQTVQAQAAVSAYTVALQQNLADAGYYAGAVDGVYGPETVAAVEALQTANGLPVTGTVDNATSEALQAALLAIGGVAAQQALAATAALQQTLKLVGFWDGPVDGVATPELTEALKAFQTELGVEPTGVVDAATIAAFEAAIAALEPPATPEPTPTPTESEAP